MPLICRSSWRAITSARPPGMPLIVFESCVSSISVPICVPEFSSMPVPSDDSRMLFISCCMKIASNCFAAILIAAFGSVAARARSALPEASRSASSAPASPVMDDLLDMPAIVMIR